MQRICDICGYAEDLHRPEGHKFVPSDLLVAQEKLHVVGVDVQIHDEEPETSDLERELASVLNRHCAENGSNTPDFILAEYLLSCLTAYNTATKKTREWQGVEYLNVGTKDT